MNRLYKEILNNIQMHNNLETRNKWLLNLPNLLGIFLLCTRIIYMSWASLVIYGRH